MSATVHESENGMRLSAPEGNLPCARESEDADRCRKVEDALFRRACGYVVPLRKSIKVKHIEYDAETGKKVFEREELEMGIEEQDVPADLKVCAYYLNNRDPSRWREHPALADEDVGGRVDLPETVAVTCPPPESEEFDGDRES